MYELVLSYEYCWEYNDPEKCDSHGTVTDNLSWNTMYVNDFQRWVDMTNSTEPL